MQMQPLSEPQRRCSIGALSAVLANECFLLDRLLALRVMLKEDGATSLGGVWDDQCRSLASFVKGIAQRTGTLEGLTKGTVEAFVDPSVASRRQRATRVPEALRELVSEHERVAVVIGGSLDAWRDDPVTALLMRDLLGGHARMAEALQIQLNGL
jgi:hypothetical protein